MMKSKLLPLLLALTCSLGAGAYDFEDYTCNLYFNIINNSEASLTYYDTEYNSYSGNISIPDEAEAGVLHPVEYPVTEIGQYAFRDCEELTGVVIGSNVTTIAFDAFWNCTSLQELDIPDNVTTIASWAFEGCSSLKSLTIGSGMTSIGATAFSGCTALNTIVCNATMPPSISGNTFPASVLNNATLIVPSSAVNAYRNATYWSNFANIVSGVVINSTNFPDAKFRNYLLGKYPKGYITQSEIDECTYISFPSYGGIASLKGIEFFTALETLYCCYNQITSLDLSHNTNLTLLNCHWNKITSLNVRNCTKLKDIYCGCNDLTSLDLSDQSQLELIYCFDNDLTSITFASSTPNLWSVYCSGNKFTTFSLDFRPSLHTLVIDDCESLETLYCYNNNLDSLNVTGCTGLKDLRCYYNSNLKSITGLGDCTSITYLDCEDCSIADLTAVNNMTSITYFLARKNQLSGTFDLNNKNNLSFVRLSGNSNLTRVNCYGNPNLKTLYVANCTKMTTLSCYSNALTTLDVKGCTKLYDMSCRDNQLTQLSFEGCNGLYSVFCYKNKFTEEGMNSMIATLPTRTASNPGSLKVLYNNNETNVFTNANALAAIAKYWMPKRFDGSNWVDMITTIQGDVNGDGNVNISDVTALIDYLLTGNANGINVTAADCNLDGNINISDVTALIDYLLTGNW